MRPKSTSIEGSRYELTMRWENTCRVCAGKIYSGDRAYYFPRTKKFEHYNCARRKNTT